jgi:hypothetical protein
MQPPEERRQDMGEYNTRLAVLSNDISYIKSSVTKIEVLIEQKYVLKSDFEPIRKIVYGCVALILTAVVVGIIALVVKQ